MSAPLARMRSLVVRAAAPLLQHQTRTLAYAARYAEFGDPAKVLKYEDIGAVQDPGASDVKVKMLAAPINPADFNMVQGVYGVTPQLPAVGGNEGVGVVTAVGSNVKDLKQGDWVIPANPASGFGTWQTEFKADAQQLMKVPNDIPAAYAATIAVNPCTAYRMLRDFADLKPGDVIMQNGANSMVGQAVIQMAREMGVKTINIVREQRPNIQGVIRTLQGMGGDVVVTDSYVNTPMFRELLDDLPPVKLGLNCVAGEAATEMARALPDGATLVTYGGMSKHPMVLPYEVLAYKDLTLKGFWVTAWARSHSKEERAAMINDIADMIRRDQLSFMFELFDFDDFNWALQKSMEPYRMRKAILNMDYPDRLKQIPTDEDLEVFEGSATS